MENKERRKEGSEGAAQSLQSKQPVKPPVFTHQFIWNSVWLDGNWRQRRNIQSFPLSSTLSDAKVDLCSVTSFNKVACLSLWGEVVIIMNCMFTMQADINEMTSCDRIMMVQQYSM